MKQNFAVMEKYEAEILAHGQVGVGKFLAGFRLETGGPPQR
jgi:hypothetical protein